MESPRNAGDLILSQDQRVPQTLQTVFIRSGRGKVVNKAPPAGVAAKTFAKFFRRNRYGRPIIEDAAADDDDISVASMNMNVATQRRSALGGMLDKKFGILERADSSASVTSTQSFTSSSHISPHQYLVSLLNSRGYSTKTFEALKTAYFNQPTPYQEASNGICLAQAIKADNDENLREYLDLGLSPNASNEHGESIVHMACRLGSINCLRVMLEFGCNLQVVDQSGRTPLHEACWSGAKNFDIVKLIAKKDIRMFFLEDNRGAVPLAYLREPQWTVWTKFLMNKKDVYWPDRGDIKKAGLEQDPPLTRLEPNSRPIPDPKDALPVDLAGLVACGKLEPLEVSLLKEDTGFEEIMNAKIKTSQQQPEKDDLSEATFDENEMAQILGCIGASHPVSWAT